VAFIYTRVSTVVQERDGLSLRAQRAACLRYARAHGWPVEQTYEDVASGSRDSRSQYLDMQTAGALVR
jgi:DNA invertase Pin-like site-specific DNA recombinase